MKLKKWLKVFLALASVCVFIGVAVSIYVGHRLVAPVPRTIGPPPASLGGETVRFESRSGSRIVGWLTKASDPAGTVLLLHPIRGDRRTMVGRARFFHDQGYHTLCIDFQAHGESPGQRITLGHLESMDAAAAVKFLKDRFPGLPVAVVGTSLGGAAALMADYADPPEAMVVESVYADVETGIGNRLEMRFGRPGRLLSPLLSWQIRPLLGIDIKSLNPAQSATKVHQPVLVLSGQDDQHARPSEARAIYQSLGGPKKIWEIAGADHVDLHRFAGADYEKQVGDFLASHLRPDKQ